MCDVAGILGAVLSVAASAMQAQQQAAFQSAQNQANNDAYSMSKKAREDELARQQSYEKEAAGYWDRTTADLTADKYDDSQKQAEDDFMSAFDQLEDTMPEGELLPGQKYATDEVKSEIASRANSAAADARRRVQNLAALASYGAVDQQRNTALGNNANMLTTLNGIRRGSLGVSQQEQNISPAQVSMGGGGEMADVLSGAGGLVSSAGHGRMGSLKLVA